MIYIYSITNMINGKVYIGQSKNVRSRWAGHRKRATREDGHIYRAMRAHGLDNFKFEVIDECASEYEADLQEIYLIKEYCSADPVFGYNKSLGGCSNRCGFSEESIQKMRDSHKGKKLSDEAREKLRLSSIGNKSWTGKTFSEEHRRNLSKARMGHAVSDETRKKIGNAHRGKKCSEEVKARLSEIARKQRHTEEAKRKISEAGRKRRKLSPEDTAEVLRIRVELGIGTERIGKMFGVSKTCIARVLKDNSGGIR